MSKGTKIIDSISANELLKALATLQSIPTTRPSKNEISFSQQWRGIEQMKQMSNGKTMDFQFYMAKKTEKRSSVSPIKQNKPNISQQNKLTDFKSRSHSPFQKKSPIKQPSTHQIKLNAKGKENKENKKEDNVSVLPQKKECVYRASYQSKKILDQKEKKGSVYVPIQHRTEQLLKSKNDKIAKLQKQKENTLLLSQKQCTFKPTIIKNWKKPKQTPLKSTNQKDNLKQIEEEDSIRYESCSQNEFMCMPQRPHHILNTEQSKESICVMKTKEPKSKQKDKILKSPTASHSVSSNNPAQIQKEQPKKKYKNSSFNILLDMIH